MTRREASRLVTLGGLGYAWSIQCVPSHADRSLVARSSDDAFARILEDTRVAGSLPGLAAAVVRGGTIVAKGVAGVRRHGSAEVIQPEDRFHIASCTKSMTATMAAIAVHQGRLRWTMTIAEGLPTLAGLLRPEYRVATLEQLLAHDARTPAYTQFSEARDQELKALSGTPTAQRLAFIADVLHRDEPNDGSGNAAYSNAGYAVVGAMLEQAFGVSWEDLILREIAAPLGMKTLGFGYPATASTPDQPRGHARRANRVVELPLDESRHLAVCLWPAGAIHCSINDFALYAADHLNGLRGRNALLPLTLYQRLHRPLRAGQEGFTLGWGIRQDKRWGIIHFGAGSGGWFFARIAIVPDQDVAVVTASNSGFAGAVTQTLTNELLEKFAAG